MANPYRRPNRRHYYDVRQYAVVLNSEGEMLCLQLPKAYRPYGGYWTLPGGKMEPTDVPAEKGILREIEEETMLKASVQRLLHVARWDTNNSKKLAIFYVCHVKGRRKAPVLSEEHRDAQWVKLSDIKEQKFYSPYFQEAIAKITDADLIE